MFDHPVVTFIIIIYICLFALLYYQHKYKPEVNPVFSIEKISNNEVDCFLVKNQQGVVITGNCSYRKDNE